MTFKKLLISTLFFCLTLVSCEKDRNDPVAEPLNDCQPIEVINKSVFPSDSIFLSLPQGLPANDIRVDFLMNETPTDAFMMIELDSANRPYLIAPFNFSDPLSAGEIGLQFSKNETVLNCQDILISIKELPKADGYLENVVTRLIQMIDKRIRFLGYQPEDVKGDLNNLSAELLPFALSYALLEGEEANFSVHKLLNSEEPLIEGSISNEATIDLTNRLLAHVGFKELLVDEFDDKAIRKRPGGVMAKGCEGLTPEEIGRQMRIAADAFKYLDSNPKTGHKKGVRLQKTSDALILSGFVPALGGLSGATGALVFAYKKVYEGLYQTNFTSFSGFNYQIDSTALLEELACDPLRYEKATVTVKTKGWSLDRTIWETVFQAGGLAASKIQFKETGVKHINATRDNAFNITTAFTGKQLDNLAGSGHLDGETFKVEPKSCLVPINDYKYLYAKLTGEAFELKGNEGYVYPRKTGEAGLEVGLRSAFFAGNTAKKSTALKIKPVQINTDPSGSVNVTPGESLPVKVLLNDAFEKNIKAEADEGSVQMLNFESDGTPFAGVQNLLHLTPKDESKYPYILTVEHLSNRCIRGSEFAERRLKTLQIKSGVTVEIFSDDFGCLETGDKRLFQALVSDQNKTVTWQAFNETNENVAIGVNGEFTAPEENGTYLIIATSEADPTASDTTFLEVGNCYCNWNVVIGGKAFVGNEANFNETSFPGKVTVELSNDSNADVFFNLIFNLSDLPVSGTRFSTKLVQDKGNEGEWLVIGQSPNIIYNAPAGLDAEDKPSPSPTNLIMDLSLRGTTLKGHITGNIIQTSSVSGAQSSQPIEIQFQAEELNPAEGLWGCD
ncbi:hypothetical protein [Jiulongibacter sp. NS-SX5]|uniref:hypothetical protein n=1 Tax=Jiulongibacter sp. NS-SX5 TaxID=3463854 RepID=UPI0040586323